MDFDLSDEQTMLRDALTRFLGQHYGFETRRALRKTPTGWSREVWAWLAEQGYLGVPFAESDGGLGGGAVEIMVIAEAFGGALVAEPYLATVTMAGTALRLAGHSTLIPEIVSGSLTVSFVDDGSQQIHAAHDGQSWRLTGNAAGVLHGDSAGRLVVAADRGLFMLDAGSPHVRRRGHATFDGLRAADIAFDAAPAELLATDADAGAIVERVRQHAIAFLAAEAVGIMRMLLDLTVEHLGTRKQFGQPLGKFQALQHRAVEMLVAIEQAESIKIYATSMADHPDPLERRKAFAAVKAVIGNAARTVGQSAVQLHGGIGVTDEHKVGWGMKRLTMIEMMLGDTDHHVAELAALGGFLAAAE